MNLFKSNPDKGLVYVYAIILVASVFYIYDGLYEFHFGNKISPKKTSTARKVVQPVPFGVVGIKTAGPSYAQHNFDVDPTGEITIFFNEIVNTSTLKDHVLLRDVDSDEYIPLGVLSQSLNSEENINALYPYSSWVQSISFLPEQALETSSSYEVTVLPGFSSLNNINNTASRGMTLAFTTADSPGFLSSNVLENNVLGTSSLRLVFKSPMDKDEIVNKIEITPEIMDLEYLIKVYDKNVEVLGDFEEGVEYTLYIPEGTLDLYGRALDEEINITFTANTN